LHAHVAGAGARKPPAPAGRDESFPAR
jgi:hypothetical protein